MVGREKCRSTSAHGGLVCRLLAPKMGGRFGAAGWRGRYNGLAEFQNFILWLINDFLNGIIGGFS